MDKKRKVVACIEARMTSSRLPGKVLIDIGGKSALKILADRLQESKYIDEIVIACTTNKEDDAIVKFAEENGIKAFRGLEDDVLRRVVAAVESVNGDVIVEITGDCPFMDHLVVDSIVETFLSNDYDYVTNIGYVGDSQREIPLGMDVRVFNFEELKHISQITEDPEDKEHVSLYFFRTGKNIYKLHHVDTPAEWKRDYNPRLCLDTKEDLEALRKIYTGLNGDKEKFYLKDILNFLDKHPEIVEINSEVVQKTVKDL